MKKSPILVVLSLFIVNVIAVVIVVNQIRPKPPKDFTLYQVTIQKPDKEQAQTIFAKPVTLKVPTADIDIQVKDGEYNSVTKEWTLTKDSAHYAVLTPEPNNIAGNTFIYGHNNNQVFGRLSKIKPGDKVSVIGTDGKEFIYQHTSSKQVEPTDVSLFSYQGTPILTLQTCSGTWYEKRTLYTFVFVEVK